MDFDPRYLPRKSFQSLKYLPMVLNHLNILNNLNAFLYTLSHWCVFQLLEFCPPLS